MARLDQRMQAALTFVLITICAAAHASDARVDRGELLYETHCLACHTEQMHWREQRLVTDLESLAMQVQRWETVTRAGWSNEDIEAVVRYLNKVYYRFPPERERN